MKINLKDIKVFYINRSDMPNRNKTMISMLDSLGLDYTRVEAITRTDELYDIIADSHIQILKENNPPYLILEDDCLPFDYRDEIEVPDDADVVFLGVTSGTTNIHTPKYEKINDDVWRLKDMTSLHAVLYLNQNGEQWLYRARELAIKAEIGFDMATAMLMPNAKIYGLNSPMWYQRDIADITKLTLEEALEFDDYYGGGYEDYEEPIDF